MKKCLLLFAILQAFMLRAQEIYVINNLNEIKTINVETLEVTDLFGLDIQQIGYITDLAFSPQGRLFGVNSAWQLIEIDLQNQSAQVLADLPQGDAYTALICNSDSELLTSRYLSMELYKYDLDTGITTFVDNNISTPGDFTYYKGNLVYPNFYNDVIRGYNGNDLFDIGCSVPLIWTFVNVFEDCQNNNIYALDQFAKMYRYDLESTEFEFIADLVSETGTLYGGATVNEYMASACAVEPLTEVSCNLNTNSFNPYGISLRKNPVDQTLFLKISLPATFRINIHSTDGKLLLDGTLINDEISVGRLQSGSYVLSLIDEQGFMAFRKKFIKI